MCGGFLKAMINSTNPLSLAGIGPKKTLWNKNPNPEQGPTEQIGLQAARENKPLPTFRAEGKTGTGTRPSRGLTIR
jgi:hypothetical protein